MTTVSKISCENGYNNYVAKELIETLKVNAIREKQKINDIIEEIIRAANQRRTQLENEIDIITKRKIELVNTKNENFNVIEQKKDNLKDFPCNYQIHLNTKVKETDIGRNYNNFNTEVKETDHIGSNLSFEEIKKYICGNYDQIQVLDIDVSPYTCETIRSVNLEEDTTIDVNMTHLLNILDIFRNINDAHEKKQYIKQIRHGLEGDQLLFTGYIRNIITQARMSTNKDVESLCFRYYSLNSDPSERSKNEEKFNVLCLEIKKILGDKVEDVIIDDFHRKIDVPFRIIDHSLQHSFVRKPTKITIAINPSNAIIETMFNRFSNDSLYDKTVKHVAHLLYGTHLAACDVQLTDPYSLCKEVHRLIKLGLAIYDSDSDSSTESDDNTEHSYDSEHISLMSEISDEIVSV